MENKNKILSFVYRWMDEKMLDGFTAPLLGKYPNTYTFTKALAEHLIEREAGNIPFVIVRPSIVSSTISDPFPVSCFYSFIIECLTRFLVYLIYKKKFRKNSALNFC